MSKSVTKVSQTLLDMLNTGIAMEMQVSIQYVYQHIQWSGVKGFAVHDEFKGIAMQEMKHCEAIAERLYYLGGLPTTKPTPVFVGSTLADMVEQDIKDETASITLYKKIINQAMAERDETTSQLFREILKDEESHHDTFITLAEAL
jgi:bacterioferritin